MCSRVPRARSRRRPFGTDSTGLPATVISARTDRRPVHSMNTAPPAVERAAPAQPGENPDDVDGGRRQQHAAGLVETAGHEVERLLQPGGERPVALRAEPHAAVARRPLGVCEAPTRAAVSPPAPSRCAGPRARAVDRGRARQARRDASRGLRAGRGAPIPPRRSPAARRPAAGHRRPAGLRDARRPPRRSRYGAGRRRPPVRRAPECRRGGDACRERSSGSRWTRQDSRR